MNEETTSRAVNGTCAFCGQTMIVEKGEDEWLDVIRRTNMSPQDIADEEATLMCICPQGREHRKKRDEISRCADNIEAMFRDKYPDVADLLQEAKALVYDGQPIKKVTITMPEGAGVAMISYGKTGLKIEHRKLLRSELSTGLE